MHIFEIIGLMFFVVWAGITITCYLLAKSKNRNTNLALVNGIIPFYNIFALIYYVGAPVLKANDGE